MQRANNEGYTALLLASQNDHSDIVALLLQVPSPAPPSRTFRTRGRERAHMVLEATQPRRHDSRVRCRGVIRGVRFPKESIIGMVVVVLPLPLNGSNLTMGSVARAKSKHSNKKYPPALLSSVNGNSKEWDTPIKRFGFGVQVGGVRLTHSPYWPLPR